MAFDMTTALTIKANVVGENQITGLQRGLGKVAGQSNRTATAMQRLRKATGGALGAMRNFLPVLGLAGIGAFAKSTLDAADSMSKLSQRTGIAVPALDRFRQAANLSDTSIQSLERGFPALTKNMKTAADTGKGPMFNAFQQLGVSITDASGKLRGADVVMLQIADRFQGMADGSEKAALASTIFGTRIGSELIPMLNLGGETMRNFSTVMTQDFADRSAAFNDKLTIMKHRLQETGTTIMVALLPHLERLADAVDGLATAFSNMPEPLQAIILGVGALAAAFVLLAPAIPGIVLAFKGLAALKIGATLAGWAAVIPMIGTALSGLLPILAGVFTGPVGWIALAAAAGVALFAFRDNIAAAFSGLVNAVKAPFNAIAGFIKGIFNAVIGQVQASVNAAIGALNRLIRIANRALRAIGLSGVGTIPNVNLPRFADGGVVNGPTVAMVGEGGEPEYIIPQSKMAHAAANYLGGARGRSVIPAFANGGVVGPGAAAGGMSGGAANTTVQITTGPVLQQDGQNYVTVNDLERALKSFGNQMFRNARTPGGRRYQGIYA